MKKILYSGFGWTTNIGNAFIDYGVQYSLKEAYPEHSIHFASNTQSWLRYRYTEKFGIKPHSIDIRGNKHFDLRLFFDADYYVLGGALLNKAWFEFNTNFINWCRKEKPKIIIYGGSGGNKYTAKEISYVRNILKELNLHALISRDKETYSFYSDLAHFAYNGIDSAFFVSDVFKPAVLNLPAYVVFTFDSMKEPMVETGSKMIIRLYHSAWDLGRLENIVRAPLQTITLMARKDLISDFPDDYLHIYANCEVTYSDRVHACVAALAFGKKAMYFGKSPRSMLFDRLGLTQIQECPVTLDQKKIKIEKEKQINFLRSILK